jgi:hypothetical protein
MFFRSLLVVRGKELGKEKLLFTMCVHNFAKKNGKEKICWEFHNIT